MTDTQAAPTPQAAFSRSSLSQAFSPQTPPPEVRSVSDQDFHEDINAVLRESEEFRLRQMALYRSREFMTMTITLLSVLVGGGAFAWFLLIDGHVLLAIICMAAAILPHVFLRPWVQGPVKAYKIIYKESFMPRIAQSMGGLQFNAKRGIGRKVLSRTGIVPAHDVYLAEDCFSGQYKNAKITLSEARLMRKSGRQKFAFDGIFVLIELAAPLFKGHTVITADIELAKRLSNKLQRLPINTQQYAGNFYLLSNQPDHAGNFDHPKLLKELYETMVLFENAQLSAAFFGSKYIFMQIPYEKDMFEASDVFVPITTNDAALRCKKEIEQLMSIVDIVHVYESQSASGAV